MGIWIQVSAGSDKAIYVQIMEQIGYAIARGVVTAGDKLPAVRKLAAELIVNPSTVANAYRLLEKEGLLTTKAGSGTFVCDLKLRPVDASMVKALAQDMDTVITRGLNLGLSGESLVDMFEGKVKEFTRKL